MRNIIIQNENNVIFGRVQNKYKVYRLLDACRSCIKAYKHYIDVIKLYCKCQ